MNVSSYDEALGLPSHAALRVALRTQQIIAEESGVVNTADPLGGSYYVESLTDEIEKRATELFNKVLSMGGAMKAIESRFYQNEIARSAYRNLRDLEGGRKIMVGVNKYQVEEKVRVKPTKVKFAEEREQIQRLKKLRLERDNARVQQSLRSLKEAAQEGVNLVDPILEAVMAYATIGEIWLLPCL